MMTRQPSPTLQQFGYLLEAKTTGNGSAGADFSNRANSFSDPLVGRMRSGSASRQPDVKFLPIDVERSVRNGSTSSMTAASVEHIDDQCVHRLLLK